jgi:PAS domain-containing protein
MPTYDGTSNARNKADALPCERLQKNLRLDAPMPPKKKKAGPSPRAKSVDHRFAKTILDSITAHVAILDKNGFILETNRAWKEFARQNRIQMRPDTLDVNYLEICDRSSQETDGNSSMVASGIRDVISGKSSEFVMDYPCHSPDEKRWFYMRVTKATGPGPIRIVVSHENITAFKLAEERLRESEEALWFEKQKLEEANTALRVLLRKRESDQYEMESNVLDSIRYLVTPVMRRLSGQTLRSYLKNVFQPNICVGFAFQILDIFNICLRLETRIRLDLEPESYF